MNDAYDALKNAEGFPKIEGECPQCNAKGFGDIAIKKREKDWEYIFYICQQCGYKFLSSESGMTKGIRILKSEPPECSAKPKQLLSGGER